MASGNSTMVMDTGAGWSRGLKNLMRRELYGWFGTRTWLIQLLIWVLVAVGIPIVAFLASEEGATGAGGLLTVFNALLAIAAPIGVCVIMQEAIVGEKQAGTAAWVLSKPASRLAFIASKIAGNALGMLVTMVLVPGLLIYLVCGLLADTWLAPLGFLAALGVQVVHLCFYAGLTLMMGSFSNHRGPVIGVPLAFLFVQQFLPGLYNGFGHVLPLVLSSAPSGSNAAPVTLALMLGTQPETYLPLFTTLGAGIVFVVIAARVFQRQEL